MNKSIWRPRWRVFLPIVLPLLGYLWFRLGMELNLPLMIAPGDGPDSDPLPAYPAWIISGYYAVFYILILAVSWGALLIIPLFDWIGGTPHAHLGWAYLLGVAFGPAVHCLALYAGLLIVRWTRRRPAAQPTVASFS